MTGAFGRLGGLHDSPDGSSGDDTLVGGPGNDKLDGGGGDDSLGGGGGNDKIIGGKGSDTIDASQGNHKIWADQDDTIFGDDAGDTIKLTFEGDGSDEDLDVARTEVRHDVDIERCTHLTVHRRGDRAADAVAHSEPLENPGDDQRKTDGIGRSHQPSRSGSQPKRVIETSRPRTRAV